MTNYPVIHLKKSYSKYDKFQLVEDCLVKLPDGYELLIPEGYETDFATVPQIFWSMFPAHGLASMPSVVHDFMYDYRVYEDTLGEKLARKYADICFLEHMKKIKVPKWQRYTYFYVVRLFGRGHWIN